MMRLILSDFSHKLNHHSVFIRWFILPGSNNLIIGVVADYLQQYPHDSHSVGAKYVRAVVDSLSATPILFPALGLGSPFHQWLSLVDGVLLTGAYSNVEPKRYGGANSDPGTEHDQIRDDTTLPLIAAALELDVPVFGVCRGFQEINVALGGTLHQKVHEQNGLMDHREDKSQPLDIQYAPVHAVALEKDGYLYGAIGESTIQVNSVHQQGVDQLAAPLRIEALADDGLIEGFSLKDKQRFLLGVQWHPEWKVTENDDYQKIFSCFGAACSARKKTTADTSS